MSSLSAQELASITTNPYKKDFPLFAASPDLVFLDSAATAQRPACVLDALEHFYTTMNANPLRGLYSLSVAATDAIEDARGKIARFIGADNPDEIVFCRNTSEALNLAAHSLSSLCLSSGDEIVVSIAEHHSNIIPWQQVCKNTGAKLVYMYLDENFELPQTELEKIGPNTKIVSVTHVSNVVGVRFNIAAIAQRAHKYGAYVCVDGAQSVPHTAVDVRALDCDLFACSAHKFGGPMGIGMLWGKKELLDAMPPFLTGGEMIDSVREQDATWAPVPAKFEAGTQDAAGAYATGICIDYLNTLDFAALEAREKLLACYLCESLDELDFVNIIGPRNGAKHIGVVSFNVNGVHPHDVASLLDMQGICIRAGHHCAEPLLTYLNEQSSCRASIAFYNDKNDIDRLVEGLKKVWSIFNG